jgi:molecular chaperone GrpE
MTDKKSQSVTNSDDSEKKNKEVENSKMNQKNTSKVVNSDIVMKKNIDELKDKLKDVEDKLLRELAENDNLRKRHEKEVSDSFKYSIKTFSLDILTVSDNFQRAIHSIPKDELEKSSVLKNLVLGLESVEKEMLAIFERNGVKPFVSMKEKFDPELHQAVSHKHHESETGLIIEEMQKGYKIADRLLRPAMVVVSKGPEEKNKKPTSD